MFVLLWVMEGNYTNWYINMEKKSISVCDRLYVVSQIQISHVWVHHKRQEFPCLIL